MLESDTQCAFVCAYTKPRMSGVLYLRRRQVFTASLPQTAAFYSATQALKNTLYSPKSAEKPRHSCRGGCPRIFAVYSCIEWLLNRSCTQYVKGQDHAGDSCSEPKRRVW